MKLEYEIYKTALSGFNRVNISGKSYALCPADKNGNPPGAEYDPACAGQNPVLDAWIQAAKEVGVPLRFSWRGIVNEMGHYGSVAPPWGPKEKNWGRA